MQNLLIFALCIGMGYASYTYAKRRGRDGNLWFILGFLFGIFGLLALFLLPSKNKPSATKPIRIADIPLEQPPATQPLLGLVHPTHSSKLWYYLDKGNQQFGPMSLHALTNAWTEGKIDGSTYVWNEELTNWERFEAVLKPVS